MTSPVPSSPSDIHDGVPSTCHHCGGRLPSRRTIIPNRRRWFIHFVTIFVGLIAFWVFMWLAFISNVGTKGEGTLIDGLLMERNAVLVLAIAAAVVWHLTRKMPDTVIIRCATCRKDNRFLVRFAGRAKPTVPASLEGSPRQQQSPGNDP